MTEQKNDQGPARGPVAAKDDQTMVLKQQLELQRMTIKRQNESIGELFMEKRILLEANQRLTSQFMAAKEKNNTLEEKNTNTISND